MFIKAQWMNKAYETLTQRKREKAKWLVLGDLFHIKESAKEILEQAGRQAVVSCQDEMLAAESSKETQV